MAKKTAVYKDKETNAKITLIQNDDNTIDFEVDNAKGLMRLISKAIGFEYDPDWNTQTLGSKLIDVLNNPNQTTETKSVTLADYKDGLWELREYSLYYWGYNDNEDFKGIPVEFKDVKDLEVIKLDGGNNITLNKKIDGFDSVERFIFDSGCELEFPIGLSKLKNLNTLFFQDAYVKSIPSSLTGFESLEELVFWEKGSLTLGDIKNLQALPNLRYVALSGEWSDEERKEIKMSILPNAECKFPWYEQEDDE